MDRLAELSLLATIIETGSLSAAARLTHRSPAAVTRALVDLEQRLGVRLIERTTRRLAPTEAGLRLAAHGRRLLAEWEEAIQDGMGETSAPRGRLRLSAPLAFGQRYLTPIVLEFLSAYPEIQVDLSFADQFVDLIEDGIDLALRIGALQSSSVIARPLGSVIRIVTASPEYLKKHGCPEQPADLKSHHCILRPDRMSTADWQFADARGGTRNIAVSGRFRAGTAEAAIAAAIAGHGVLTTLSYQVRSELEDGRLVRLLEKFEPTPIPIQFVYPSAGLLPSRTRAFLDFAIPRISTLGPFWLPPTPQAQKKNRA